MGQQNISFPIEMQSKKGDFFVQIYKDTNCLFVTVPNPYAIC